ncbi:MAG: hypothetical protein GXO23_02150 [Crenarchaeota archaeon]|nr:hypothetical protein [Thermoproteota archaeon]
MSTKRSVEKLRCPLCGTLVIVKGSVKYCPHCGFPVHEYIKAISMYPELAKLDPETVITVYRNRESSTKKRKIVLISLGVIALLLLFSYLGYVISQYVIAKECRVTVSDIEIEHIGVTGADLLVVLEIYNPNNIPARIPAISYEVLIDGIYVGTGYINNIEVPPHSTWYARSTFRLRYSGAISAIIDIIREKLFHRRSINVTIEGTANVNVGPSSFSLQFSRTKVVDP